MDDSRMQARTVVTAMVARDFEPVRIERQLLARAFDLVCEVDTQTHGPTQEVAEPSTTDQAAEQPASIDIERRRAA